MHLLCKYKLCFVKSKLYSIWQKLYCCKFFFVTCKSTKLHFISFSRYIQARNTFCHSHKKLFIIKTWNTVYHWHIKLFVNKTWHTLCHLHIQAIHGRSLNAICQSHMKLFTYKVCNTICYSFTHSLTFALHEQLYKIHKTNRQCTKIYTR